jgi:transcriptional regulator with XRE-family HTH domain
VVSKELQLFAKNFRVARTAAGLTQSDVHEATGIAVSYVSAVERGLRSVTIEYAARLAKSVDVPLHKLLTP